MAETFDTETVLNEILDVLRKHHIPANTVSVDISMLGADFDATFPELPRPRRFYRPTVIDNVPMRLSSERRLPFDELVRLLQAKVLPIIKEFHDALVTEYPTLPFRLVERHEPDFYSGEGHLYYQIAVECQFLEDMREDYNILQLEITLTQDNAASYARLEAGVGWRIDWESDGSWVLELVSETFPSVNPRQENVEGLQLRGLFRRMRDAIDMRLIVRGAFGE